VREPHLERASNPCVPNQEVPRPQQEVDKVERTRSTLQVLVATGDFRELAAQQGRQVSVSRLLKPLDSDLRRFERPPDAITLEVAAVHPASNYTGLAEGAVLRQVNDARLPSVEIVGIEAPGSLDIVAELANGPCIEKQWISRGGGTFCKGRQLVDASDDLLELLLSVE
jgi:hypothetical protein